MSVFIGIVLILVSIVLIVAVLMQEGNKQGLGAIGGAAETFLGKNKSKSYEGKLLTITKIGAAVFVVLAILLTWMNSRTYTVKYFNEDGTEYFPAIQAQVDFYTMLGNETSYDALLASTGEENARASYGYGDTVYAYGTPVKEGYVGTWDKALPEKMDRSNYELHPVYELGTYTITVNVTTTPDENGDVETTVLTSATGLYQSEVDAAALTAAIEGVAEVEGYNKVVSGEVPATMPGHNTVITVTYEKIADETAPEAEAATEAPAEQPVEEAAETVAPVTEEATETAAETEKKD